MKKPFNSLLMITLALIACDDYAVAAPTKETPSVTQQNSNYRLILRDEKTNKNINVSLTQFNPELYDLAYRIFTMNDKTMEAYLLAQAAVKQRPNDLTWRRRLAQVSIWNSQYQTALDQWLFITRQTNDPKDAAQGITIAKQIYNYDALSELYWLELSKDLNNQALWKDYITSMQIAAKPQGAIDKLKSVLKTHPSEFLETQLAILYRSLGQINHEQGELKLIHHESPTVALNEALVLINEHKVKQAFEALEKAKNNASPDDKNFWAMYSQLAWTVNNRAGAIHGYQVVLKQGKPELETYLRLISLLNDKNPQLALQYSKDANAAFKTNAEVPLDTLALQQKLGRWHDMGETIYHLTPSQLKELEFQPYFWSLKAERWQQQDRDDLAQQVYRQGIAALPNSVDLRKDYWWFLINSDNRPALALALNQAQPTLPTQSELWGPAAVGYFVLGQREASRNILSLYSKDFKDHLNDPYWLLDYADVYDQSDMNSGTDFPQRSHEVLRYTWPLYLKLIRQQDSPLYYDQLLEYLKLSQQEAAGDPTYAAAALLMKDSATPESAELIIAWATERNNFDGAQSFVNYYQRMGIKPRATGLLALALHQENRYAMRKLLADRPNKLQYRDRVQAAAHSGALLQAQTLAYQGLKEHPTDNQMYELFTDVMFRTSNHFDMREEFYQYGPLQGPRTYLAATYFVTPKLSITPYTLDWFVQLNSKEEMAMTPSPDLIGGIKARLVNEHGFNQIDVARRKSLESFTTAELSGEYSILHDLTAIWDLGYHQLSNDTAILYEGGYLNEAAVQFNYTLSQYDFIDLGIAQKYFYTQDNRYLSSGNTEEVGIEHYFWLEYPDLSLRFYNRDNQYRPKTQTLSGPILKLLPPNEDGIVNTNVNQAIPPSATEFGLRAQFGMKYQEEYTHSYKPFASFTIMYNSSTGMGHVYDVGVAGSVFGRDHLALYYENGTNQAPGIQKELLIGLSYRYDL